MRKKSEFRFYCSYSVAILLTLYIAADEFLT
jgi:hypothetical protein